MGMKWNGPLEELPDRLLVVIKEQTVGGYLKHPDTVAVYAKSIKEVVTDLWDAFSDGFDLADLATLGEALAVLTKIAVDTESFSDKVTDECVGDFALTIYKIWDPDIPYLWESAENKLESAGVRMAVSMAVSGFRRLLKERAEEDHLMSEVSEAEAASMGLTVDGKPIGDVALDGVEVSPAGDPDETSVLPRAEDAPG